MSNDEETPAEPVDPREQMRQALERKKNGARQGGNGSRTEPGKPAGAAHGPAAAKKQFTRRKAGG